ncbi:hypothetical protein NEAUS03_2420, partial [Nematocida ausubeli]
KQVQSTLLYEKEHRDVDTLLLNPLIHNIDHITQNVWGILLYAIEKKLDKNHPFLRLADNILNSTYFMATEIRNPMFIFLSHISVDKHHLLTRIDKSIYEEYLLPTISEVVNLAKITKFVSQTMYANIITDLMISFQRKCTNDDYKRNGFTKKLISMIQEKSLLMEILTLNGTTVKYIAKIIQSMKGVETKHPANDCKRFGNLLLLYIIYSAHELKYAGWTDIVKGCYDLIDIEIMKNGQSDPDYSIFTWAIEMTNVFKEVKDIVCVESDSTSMERFSTIQSNLPKSYW